MIIELPLNIQNSKTPASVGNYSGSFRVGKGKLNNLRQKNGFASITEVAITSIIFSIAALSIVASFANLAPQREDATAKLHALYAGRAVLQELRNSVDAGTWNSAASDLAPGNHTKSFNGYTVNYRVTPVAGFPDGFGPRKVTMTVGY